MENKRIPFDWEKYQSGEFEAVCRANWKVDKVVNNPTAAKHHQIVFWVNGLSHFCSSEGLNISNEESDIDLFLIPKTKKFQAWVNLYSNGNLTIHLIESESEKYKYELGLKGIKTIETRLIEWEG